MTDEPLTSGVGEADGSAYQVLARKYRPATFADLVGQEAAVRTLTNAISSGRLAQGYMLTGVRGVGKTTTARLIARALNCVGPDGTGGPTANPCGVCANCLAIAEDRHVDVLEMDAASRTGIDDIRELLEGVRYRPTSARYKIYIIDEIHMLSDKAFNALLKTLEEPPEHVKFIFATTEIRKVPVTVLSRCQRFDLRRIESDTLISLFGKVAGEEKVAVEDGALALIARAADGSARDGLSILDQAISQAASGTGAVTVTEAQVRDMLGLADRAQVFDLFDAVMRGDIKTALDLLGSQYAAGADPLVVVQDLLELCHWLTRLKVAPDGADDAMIVETERTRGADMAANLSMPVLTRTWQMLLKGLNETRFAPMPLQAVEMLLVRLAYAADLPSPEDAVKSVVAGNAAPPASRPRPNGGNGGAPVAAGGGASPATARAMPASEPASAQEAVTQAAPAPAEDAVPKPTSFAEVAALFDERREGLLAGFLKRSVHLVAFEPGRIELRPMPSAPQDLPGRVGALLSQWTGERWVVSVSNTAGAPTLHEQEIATASSDPFVKSLLDAFPGATIEKVRAVDGDDEPGPSN